MRAGRRGGQCARYVRGGECAILLCCPRRGPLSMEPGGLSSVAVAAMIGRTHQSVASHTSMSDASGPK